MGLVRAAASRATEEEVSVESATPRRITKIRIILQQWLSCLVLLLRSKVEFLNHVEKTYGYVTYELQTESTACSRGPGVRICRPPFTSELRRLAKQTLDRALRMFPNDSVLLSYVVAYNTPGIWKPCFPLYSSWGARLCDDVLSKFAFLTGSKLDDMFPLWKTAVGLKLFQTISSATGCVPSGGTSFLYTEALFERVSFELERCIEVIPAGSKAAPVIWTMYIEALCSRSGRRVEDVRRLYYRAIHQCPWSKRVWVMALSPRLQGVFKRKEMEDLRAVMEEKGIMLRVA